mmetsp:Transcript_46463/g.134565  ORF Transcript_46463/g.134565 Transcript_46463/m.134565 type:complete len:312 (-) Transcript_46463:413-1348(-)
MGAYAGENSVADALSEKGEAADAKDSIARPYAPELQDANTAEEETGMEAPREPEEAAEPSASEHARVIAAGTLCSGAAYGLCRLLLSSEHTEDTVDMVHSLATSSTALYGLASMERHPLHTRALPENLASGRGPVVKMFSLSLGYFLADFAKIAVDVLLRGKFPHLWAGRLAHHTIQLGANWPGIFCKGKPRDQALAWRSVLCMAYIAEVSSIFLRLSNLIRQGPPGARGLRLRRAINWALVLSFFGSRIVNFACAISMFVQARPVLPPMLFGLGAAVQASGYGLSAVWFTKILRIALKTTGEATLPSIEC